LWMGWDERFDVKEKIDKNCPISIPILQLSL
jgi:hypothetical protein